MQRLDTHPSFGRAHDDTDYGALAATAGLLDMAVDDGCAALTGDGDDDRVRFDAAVDELTNRLERINATIYDSGLAHVHRTEAKGAITAVLRRLEYTVRTRPVMRHGRHFLEALGEGQPKPDGFRQLKLKGFVRKDGAAAGSRKEGVKKSDGAEAVAAVVS